MANNDCVLGNKNAIEIKNLKESIMETNKTIKAIFTKMDNLKAWVIGSLFTFLSSLCVGLIIVIMRKA